MKQKTYHFLQYFGIEARHLEDKRYLSFIVLVFVGAIALSIKFGIEMASSHGDFPVFWWAGKNFSVDNDLYSQIGGATRYIYPPFAAMCFQVFSLTSLASAGSWWAFSNFGLFAMSVVLMRKIFLHFGAEEQKLNWALLAGVLISFRYFWYLQMYIQMNELIFVLCLAGIWAYLQGKETLAISFFVFGTFLKILPIFFLIWIVIMGNWKTPLKIALISLFCVVSPILFRGWEQNWIDHLRYYHVFLAPFQNGRVEPEFCNYSLSSMIYNLCQPTVNEPLGYNYRLFLLSLSQTQLLNKAISGLLLLTMFGLFAYARWIKKSVGFWEIAYTFLIMNLLSAICWEYHLVSVIFVFVPMFYLVFAKKYEKIDKILLYFLLACATILNFIGTDTVGEKIHHYIGGYGFITLLWLLLSFLVVYLFFK
jgi:hypothetical protein